MCQNGVNTDQTKLMVTQADDALGMAQKWLEQLHHLTDHAGLADAGRELAQASVLIGEARAKLQDASDVLDGQTAGPDVTVEIV